MRVEFVSGKGGVGKSAVAGALARLHARRGERVVAVAMLPGGGLGAHLGLAGLESTPSPGVDGTFGFEVRRVAALEEYVRLHSPVPLLARLGRAIRAFDALATAAPGVRELITVGKILHDAGDWDRVIVDAAPTGQLGSYLAAPDVIRGLIPSGRVADQASRLIDDLRRSSTVHFVTLAEELPVTETLEAIEELKDLPPPMGTVFVNRTLLPLPALPPSAGPVRDAALLQQSLAEHQAAWRAKVPPGPVLPFLFGATDPLLISDMLATALAEWP